MGILYYQERETGDYLAVDTSTARYYQQTQGKTLFEGRSTAIAGEVGSVCTTSISPDYLKDKCRKVLVRKVPKEWLDAIGYHEADPQVHDFPFGVKLPACGSPG